ncbi:MAG: 30S ribosomal protein S12 methylthiotransferase RimO [Candidatus Omnitrophota bacterium]|jgi:ribosomal protein S12 methylthiotransferase
MSLRVGILSLGCPRNLVDSETILSRLAAKGLEIVDIDKADIAIVNTCAFVDDAKRESIDVILDLIQAKKEGSLKKIIVSGCLSQRYKEELVKELPEVDAFMGRLVLDGISARFAITPKHFAYLKICEGCVNACSYCVIPKIKGKFTSLDEASIIRKVAEFDKGQIAELNIIGQDITGYGVDLCGRPSLSALLRKIVKSAKHIHWIRLLYLYPNRVDDDLLKVIRDEPKICKYIDLPVQHINERILKLMNRGTTRKEIVALINKIRKTIPNVALRTSLITGFPTETEKEHQELLDFMKEVKFERLGAFVYSREEGTKAYALKGQVGEKTKQERFKQIMLLQQDISREVNKKFIGRTMEVLIDEKEEKTYLARTQYDAPEVDGQVYLNSKKNLKPGDFIKVKITDTLEYDLVGEVKS